MEIDGKEVSLDGTPVTWTVESSSVSCAAWNRNTGVYNGLTWGMTPLSLSAAEGDKTTPGGTAPRGPEASLTDIVGEREVTVTATVEYNGQSYTAEEKTVSFGNGPLSVFAGQPSTGSTTWAEATTYCGGKPGDPSQAGYQRDTNLPTIEQLQAVSGGRGYGAAFAAGWHSSGWYTYWTGQAFGGGIAWFVYLDGGDEALGYVEVGYRLAVCLP